MVIWTLFCRALLALLWAVWLVVIVLVLLCSYIVCAVFLGLGWLFCVIYDSANRPHD